jgi:hypothetical protein
MKKLVLFFAAVLFTAISANVYAQNNTGETPTPNSIWNYSVTDNGNTYTWSVTKGDLTTDALTDADLSATAGASIDITWASTVTVGDWYYVRVVEDDGSCTNTKVLPVQITASQFYLSIAAIETGTACYDGNVVVTLDGNTPKYNHGTATVSYNVTPNGIGSATGYSFDIAEVFTPTAGLSSAPTVTSSNGSISGSTVTVTDASAVTLQFVVTNATLFDNSTDPNGTAADFNQAITHSGGISSHGVTDNGTGLDSANTNVARPHTTIGTN